MHPPKQEEFATFYTHYVKLVTESDGLFALEQSGKDFVNFLRTLPAAKGTFRYAAGKWSINELIQHIIDSEVIFLYRALRIARNDQTPLPGFEQDDYVPAALSDYHTMAELIDVFEKTRALSLALFKSFPPQAYSNVGTANGQQVSVRAIGFIMSGHVRHHLNILIERYV